MSSPVVKSDRTTRLETFGLWGRSFRPFFLALSIYTALAMPWWVAIWLGATPAPPWLIASWWHGHEMLFGMVAAAIAGFLLTASPVWTGGPIVSGRPLIGLAVLWLGGRVAMAVPGLISTPVAAAVDLLFLPVVALAVVRTLLAGERQARNFAVVGLVLGLAAANAAMHAEALGFVSGVAGRALRLAVGGTVVLVLVIGGRIIPAFTGNALRRDGVDRQVVSRPVVGGLAIGATAAYFVGLFMGAAPQVSGSLASVAGLAAAARMAGWQPWHSRSDPLLWSLQLGSAWLAAGLLLSGASDLGAPIPAQAGLHALTVGGVGGTILAVITRVGLGHTGRPLRVPRYVTGCYVLLNAAAVARVAMPFFGGPAQRALLLVAGLAWAVAFGLFAMGYAPMLVRPRADGRPG